MHPALLLIPAAALIIAPRWWAGRVLQQHHRDDEPGAETARELSRRLLDEHQLQSVAVEVTDLGDHYDPTARAVRLARDKADRRTLTALTTAAHEVAHAIQHATGYPPFRWRFQLVRVARIAGQGGTVLLLAVPVAALVSRQRLPPTLLGAAALAMLSTGAAAQLSAVPVEIDASFRRALPLLGEGNLAPERMPGARRILMASSLTYFASSLVGVVHIWPWVHLPRAALVAGTGGASAPRPVEPNAPQHHASGRHMRGGKIERVFRRVAKPLVRSWLRAGMHS